MTSQYEQAGVNIHAGEDAVDDIKSIVKQTHDSNVLSGIGGFGAEYELTSELTKLKEPVLISGTDGVGTKLMLAIEANNHATIGIDLVAMCANDVLAQGAKPLFFLDYIGLGKLEPEKVTAIVKGIAVGCQHAGLSLIGGEMAEMPGIYHSEDYDLSGFAVGIADKSHLLGAMKVQENDILVGLNSSGVHSNGYSLVRKIIQDAHLDLNKVYPGLKQPLIDALLTPTQLYFHQVYPLVQSGKLHAIAHITGGGLADNLGRMVPEGLTAEIDPDSWQVPSIFKVLQDAGNVSTTEMRQVFNMGLGMVLVVSPRDIEAVEATLAQQKTGYQLIGKVVKRLEQPVQYRE
ncbi:phosphoribosylformylglycinamidine cyclo-ligase [Lactobacillus sp. LC28-10]|uniref:Phosphoribosylformylglycinamidine cyclo-ligase n=1 Tax=Secundilactobacillus angelensis TaxID=2722706 RepID=A0ABX1KZ16_9LACO|nr:phosphoribosylformylglycinamidine cyclo-ligase [Secundilactobacillus angelensis]MCH5463255.1 phosphoribosylformylglycinamidine cyclo-ligase [Secundilactobacillus angelensis]NLR19183.1 phosphoribosylformylglycinamidine cyclo-ligase [Secundilactobacillus angelensis]